MKKNKKVVIIGLIILIVILLGFFIYNIFKNGVKNQIIGNNSSSQEIVDYILNISSYELEVEVEVNSNKTTNKYVIEQKYISPDTSIQEVKKPENIEGMKITRKNNQLKIENTKLETNKIFEEYEGMTDSIIDLYGFIKNYKENNGQYKEKDGYIVMTAENSNDNKYTKKQTLYIDRTNGNPSKMEVTDINQKTTFFIIYKEVKINKIKAEDITAFIKYDLSSQI